MWPKLLARLPIELQASARAAYFARKSSLSAGSLASLLDKQT